MQIINLIEKEVKEKINELIINNEFREGNIEGYRYIINKNRIFKISKKI